MNVIILVLSLLGGGNIFVPISTNRGLEEDLMGI